MSPQDPQNPQKIQQNASGYKIHIYRSVSSTNTVAKEVAKKTDEEKIVILAETQTMGRGRLGRQWISPKGGLWLSIILRPQTTPKEALRLTFIMSSAVAKTIKTLFNLKTSVKWPNDVLVNGKKISGILTETNTKESLVEFVIVGVGINVNIDLESFPSSLRATVTSLKHELGYKVKQKPLTETLLQNFENRYRRLQRGMWSALLQEWKNLADFLGKEVKVSNFDEVLSGEALDVDEDGALIIRFNDGLLKKVVAGDVTVKEKAC